MLPTKFPFIWQSRNRPFPFIWQSRNRPIRNKNCLCWPCLLTNRDKMSNLYRGPYNDASYQISVYLGKQFQGRRFFQKSTNRKQEWPVGAMFVNGSGQNEPSLQRTFHKCFLPSLGSCGQAVSEKIFKNRPIRNNNCLSGGHVC